ncbi:chemoreceptor glutamine deamidase CheD [Shewanella gaetbuli]|uniref:Probable chemoreceptor glutamine deamidase CheD n=1 Tax=Shewanella gaetbuli TaxID=220752 RepID=A0A9X1ZVD9_9GAMM|nr:chemoreceptor glutamine deamidase CheD [Shewanella gaetbuli]MCL1143046.1 chemoreceptor glutamine deamidase CheD [Shewanella gaetbuli]
MFNFEVNNSHLAPNRYYDRYFDCEAVKILPGEYFATTQNTLIVTVLGSCVSVCLRDPVLGIAGMNHFLLPSDNCHQGGETSASARYGVYAMEILINHLLKLGANKSRLEAKVFGGGNVLEGFTTVNVGERNAEFVQEYLTMERIPIIAADLLDIYPRKVYFFPETGKVLVKKIKKINNTTIFDRESEYKLKLRSQDNSGDVELFNE